MMERPRRKQWAGVSKKKERLGQCSSTDAGQETSRTTQTSVCFTQSLQQKRIRPERQTDTEIISKIRYMNICTERKTRKRKRERQRERVRELQRARERARERERE